jgi:hypothetical protein
MVTHIAVVEDGELGSNVAYLLLPSWALGHNAQNIHGEGGIVGSLIDLGKDARVSTGAGAGNDTHSGSERHRRSLAGGRSRGINGDRIITNLNNRR